ncbi:M14 family zinc carboxypeptidase [Robiginitalea aurantiaca]|uniref:DUF2817 domain-containing protein n=1 Tax=Robiginitalea aurantiaca TaxID=3056915 RepID=A0ABT7WFX1_9FLAO|nr:M14 family zinc carboxypeptidase [Robiginitalea aurantiaca]MDM9631815.1 DUF2817 domain-containing protein [Robiginitalea aurantiaca]
MKGFTAYGEVKVNSISGRYLPPQPVHRFLESLPPSIHVEVCGHSVAKQKIQTVRMGNGPVRVLLWSQMHGNESTTTKALLDLIQDIHLKQPKWLDGLELLMVPILNPDGAKAYTRQNINNIDLNRDAQDLSQPESIALRRVFEDFKPAYCFNLHDQRTIYGIETPPIPATLSFLAPAADPQRSFTDPRSRAARLIALISDGVSSEIGVGRYDDTFNINCVGDTFQAAGVPTLLLEAGHYPGDYQREVTRFYVYQSLVRALKGIASGAHLTLPLSEYQRIPANATPFVDVLVHNADRIIPGLPSGSTIGLQFEEVFRDGKIDFKPKMSEMGESQELFGHRVLDASVRDDLRMLIELGDINGA